MQQTQKLKFFWYTHYFVGHLSLIQLIWNSKITLCTLSWLILKRSSFVHPNVYSSVHTPSFCLPVSLSVYLYVYWKQYMDRQTDRQADRKMGYGQTYIAKSTQNIDITPNLYTSWDFRQMFKQIIYFVMVSIKRIKIPCFQKKESDIL